MKKILFLIGLAITILILGSSALTVSAASPGQNLVTPTPGPDGRIIYIVQEGQNCTQIATLAGIPVSQLRSLNNLDENCNLSIGQKLLIGMGGPSNAAPTATSAPAAATAVAAVTPTAEPQGEASVCVLLYEDVNGDSLRQDTENTIPGGAVSVTGTSGQYSETATTISGTKPICFDNVKQGTYNISVAAPEGFNPTTQLNYTLTINAGEQIYVDFGAQQGGEVKPQDPASEPNSTNFLGIAGGILIAGGIGLGIYAWLIYGRKPRINMRDN